MELFYLNDSGVDYLSMILFGKISAAHYSWWREKMLNITHLLSIDTQNICVSFPALPTCAVNLLWNHALLLWNLAWCLQDWYNFYVLKGPSHGHTETWFWKGKVVNMTHFLSPWHFLHCVSSPGGPPGNWRVEPLNVPAQYSQSWYLVVVLNYCQMCKFWRIQRNLLRK